MNVRGRKRSSLYYLSAKVHLGDIACGNTRVSIALQTPQTLQQSFSTVTKTPLYRSSARLAPTPWEAHPRPLSSSETCRKCSDEVWGLRRCSGDFSIEAWFEIRPSFGGKIPCFMWDVLSVWPRRLELYNTSSLVIDGGSACVTFAHAKVYIRDWILVLINCDTFVLYTCTPAHKSWPVNFRKWGSGGEVGHLFRFYGSTPLIGERFVGLSLFTCRTGCIENIRSHSPGFYYSDMLVCYIYSEWNRSFAW